MTTIQERLRHKDLAIRYTSINKAADTIDKLVEALDELSTCVEDGCYCSEMRMAAAIDAAREALKAVRGE